MRAGMMGVQLRAVPILAVVIGAGFGVMPVEAKSPAAFSSVTAAASDQHDVGVSFTETGLLPGQVVTERLRGKATDTYACYSVDGQFVATATLIEHPSNQQQYQAPIPGARSTRRALRSLCSRKTPAPTPRSRTSSRRSSTTFD
jgi:hypothetical protein